MSHLLALNVLVIACCQTAAAHDCPPGAATMPTIRSGTSFVVLSLLPEDPNYHEYAQMMGMDGKPTGDLTNTGGCWYEGPVRSDSGESFQLQKAALYLDLITRADTRTYTTNICPAESIRTVPNADTVYTLSALHHDDAYAGGGTARRETLVFEAGATLTDDCWISGQAATTSGSERHFSKVALAALPQGSRVIAGCPSTATTAAIPQGTQLKFLGIHADDDYSMGAGSFVIGDVMTTTAILTNNGSCWFGGRTEMADDSTQHFFKAAFEVVSGPEALGPNAPSEGVQGQAD